MHFSVKAVRDNRKGNEWNASVHLVCFNTELRKQTVGGEKKTTMEDLLGILDFSPVLWLFIFNYLSCIIHLFIQGSMYLFI